jgi:SOS-response transcriptional repressor LexA
MGGGRYREIAVAEAPSIPERGIAAADRTQAVLDFIKRYKTAHDGVAPTVREIGLVCDISSTSVVMYHLGLLQKQGRIVIRPGKTQVRSIEVVGGRWVAPEGV